MSDVTIPETGVDAAKKPGTPLWVGMVVGGLIGLMVPTMYHASLAASRAGALQWSVATIKTDVKALRDEVKALAQAIRSSHE